ncbi:MAG: hypothetical protein LBI12_08030 [Treponema sp.]|jgi:plastocyanin|nr:hypothetical protein [Treponema sp.]
MKKIIILLFIGLVAAGFAAAQVSAGGTLYVAVKTVSLKSGTGIFTSDRGTLAYGDRVTVLRVSGNNVEIRSAANSSLTGWAPRSSFTVNQINQGAVGNVSEREQAMAARGFNQEVENTYKTQGNYNYADVDRVEAITFNAADLRRFLEEGRLAMGGN